MYNNDSKVISGAMLLIGSALMLSNNAQAATQAEITAVETPKYWIDKGQASLDKADRIANNKKRAKNVILFIGDGMGISTVTASRIFEGQSQPGNRGGEEHSLSFEKFPHVALSKVYQVNQQTPDSAPTMSSMITGVKTNDGELSVGANVRRGELSGKVIDDNKTVTLLEQAEDRGMSTGVVSTARITHATPAACYAHISDRDWEAPGSKLPTAATVADIASQLVNFHKTNPKSDGLEVALGGGRSYFIPNTMADPEDTPTKGVRNDGVDLTAQWTSQYKNSAYVYDKKGWDAINVNNTDHLLGLFEGSHMEYEADRLKDTNGEPSLTEMTEKAIQILKKNPKGYFLMVEAGRIDHAHHAGNAYRALTDTVELSKAVQKAVDMTDSAANDTLIIVSADHSHTFTIAGYPQRGNPILGLVTSPGKTSPDLAADGKPYATLSYANGGGFRETRPTLTATPMTSTTPEKVIPDSTRVAADITDTLNITNTLHPNFTQEATVPFAYGAETHAAEEVAIYAKGPRAYLFQGTQEQSYIYQVMAKALGFAPTVYK
jgi:alkaline phosphatase